MITREFVLEIVKRNVLSGSWRKGWGALPYEFAVDGDVPKQCPNCQGSLVSNTVSYSDGENDYDEFKSCDPCGLVWFLDD